MTQPPDDDSGSGPPNPFGGLPFFGDLAKMFSGQGPINWEMARQLAQVVATEGVTSESNVDPTDRMALAELGRVARMRVEAVTGLRVAHGDQDVDVMATRAGAWAQATLEDWRPVLERLAEGLSAHADESPADPAEALMGGLMGMIGPMMLGMQSGMMVGHIASHTLGTSDVPLPRPSRREVLVVVDHVDGFARDWSIPVDEARLWVCIRELTTHAVLARPHVRDHLEALVGAYVTSFDPDPSALDDRIAGLGPALLEGGMNDPAAMQHALQDALGDPEVLLGAIVSDRQRQLETEIRAGLAAVVGYADWVLDEIGPGLMSSYRSITEALRRRRVEEGPGDRFIGRLMGVVVDQPLVDAGSSFIDGIVARAGADALATLWRDPDGLPTPAEVSAPGVWLARHDIEVRDVDDIVAEIDFDGLNPDDFAD